MSKPVPDMEKVMKFVRSIPDSNGFRFNHHGELKQRARRPKIVHAEDESRRTYSDSIRKGCVGFEHPHFHP